ncbi:hypothetical protein [Halonatronum saccharophilum]|uniref:hypothetical protein n=1 Tax=Halonatronum saccharophilum TaxID=150060 RepID=UPI001B7FBD5C|nr:hypothetical protein [Halonatronum saccharophilum]
MNQVMDGKEVSISIGEKLLMPGVLVIGVLMYLLGIGLELIFVFFTAGLLVSGLIGNMEKTVNVKYKITYICFLTILLLRQIVLVL